MFSGGNYPAALNRAIDMAGGDAFIAEFSGPLRPNPVLDEVCCDPGRDVCGWGGDGVCSCPGLDFEAEDCADQTDLLQGVQQYNQLSETHGNVTRLTTILSPEEMTFDPMFSPGPIELQGPRILTGRRFNLSHCIPNIIEPDDRTRVARARNVQACENMYCGSEADTCAVAAGPNVGCICAPGRVARRYTNLDGAVQVTCVPDTHTVDLSVDGIPPPSACLGVDCAEGVCVDVGGFPTCRCDPGKVAVQVIDSNPVPTCVDPTVTADGPGGENYTLDFPDIPVCAPRPNGCGADGWLVPRALRAGEIRGVMCPSSIPDPALLVPPPPPRCPESDDSDDSDDSSGSGGSGEPVSMADGGPTRYVDRESGCSCRTYDGGAGGLWLLPLLLGFGLRRRR